MSRLEQVNPWLRWLMLAKRMGGVEDVPKWLWNPFKIEIKILYIVIV